MSDTFLSLLGWLVYNEIGFLPYEKTYLSSALCFYVHCSFQAAEKLMLLLSFVPKCLLYPADFSFSLSSGFLYVPAV